MNRLILRPGDLDALLRHTCKEEFRAHLNSVLFDAERGLVVATNGHALILRRSSPFGAGSWLVARRQLEAVRAVCGRAGVLEVLRTRVRVYRDQSAADAVALLGRRCALPDAVVPIRPVGAHFPPYRQVIGPGGDHSGVGVNPELLGASLDALRRVAGKLSFVQLRAYGPMEPLYLRVTGWDDAEWLAVVMPARCEELPALDELVRTLGCSNG